MDKFTETVQHTFLEYLASGFELNFMVAIDFTGKKRSEKCRVSLIHFLLKLIQLSRLTSASNGNPRLPDSLHYIDPTGRLNAYQRVRTRSIQVSFQKLVTMCDRLSSLFRQ